MIKVKPITDQKLPLVKKHEELVLSQLPIHMWEKKQGEIRKRIKI